MTSAFDRFPEPPSQCSIQMQRHDDHIELLYMPPLQFPGALRWVAIPFFWIWNAGVIGMMMFGGWMCWSFVDEVIQGAKGAPQGWEIVIFAGFFIAWFGALAFFLFLGVRVSRMVSGQVPMKGWRLLINRGQWSATIHQMGGTKDVRVDAFEVRDVSVDSKGRIVAELSQQRAVLTTPLLDHDASWLRDSLLHTLGRSKQTNVPTLPYVPAGDLSNSPGTRLTYRLPADRSQRNSQIGCFLFTLAWNLIVGSFVFALCSGSIRGSDRFWFALVLTPFALVGIAAFLLFIHEFFSTVGIPATDVEIADHPLLTGQRGQIHVAQSGPLKVNSLCVLLVCEEVAVYIEGSSTRTETRRVFERELFRRDSLEIETQFPFETNCDVELPSGCMHSFDAGENSIRWRIVVKGDVPSWPDFERAFALIVYPASAEIGSNA